MKKSLATLFFILIICNNLISQELRGTWIARDAFASKENLAKIMDSLAANNFNVVYVNAWSRGYPLWKSEYFYSETGNYTDPTYTGRDLLAEAVTEGHRVGLHVEAWFEYGFVGGWTGNIPAGTKGPIFAKHPDWVEVKNDGTELDGSNYYWMSHVNPDVQNFLIGLATEVARKYDIDGIELDRIRYSSLAYGYDDFTVNLYKSEHSGNTPPTNIYDTDWLKWRADKLNEFAKRAYDSIKAINPNVNVSNAPSLYSSDSYTAYQDFAQDWVSWVNNNMLDNVQIQSYVGSSSSFGNIEDYVKKLVPNYQKTFPSFAVAPGGSSISDNDLINFVKVTRQKGFLGNSIWYYNDIVKYFPLFKSAVYSDKTYPPYSSEKWREYKGLVKITDTQNIIKTGNWTSSTLTGYSGNSLQAAKGNYAQLDYNFDVPASGIYEIYAYLITASNRCDSTEFTVYDSSNVEKKIIVDQTNPNNRRWYKLGDVSLKQGWQKVFSINNNNLDSAKVVSADAAMILLNRSKSPDAVSGIFQNNILKKSETSFGLTNFPNPFNGQTVLQFKLNSLSPYNLNIYNVLGEEVMKMQQEPKSIGEQKVRLDLDKKSLTSGVYFIKINQLKHQEVIKIVLAK